MSDRTAPAPDLDEKAILEYEVRFYSYLDPETGETLWGFTQSEGVSITEILGMVTRFAHYMAHKVEGEDGFTERWGRDEG